MCISRVKFPWPPFFRIFICFDEIFNSVCAHAELPHHRARLVPLALPASCPKLSHANCASSHQMTHSSDHMHTRLTAVGNEVLA